MTTSKLDEALWLAASECRAQKVKNLIARGADPNVKIGGMSPIQVAISKVRTRKNEFRNNRWIDIHFCPLETVKAILKGGVSVEVFNGALIYASKVYEDEDISKLLLAYTHDADQCAKQEESALKRARQIVKKLLDDEDAKVGTQPDQDRQRRERREELESKHRSILESRWRTPNIKRSASSTSFEDAKKELQSICESLKPSIQGEYSEFISYSMPRSEVMHLVETHQKRFQKLNTFLFASGNAIKPEDKDSINILPVKRAYDAIMLIGTSRNNGDGPEDVCECLKRISRNATFEIHRITFETIEGVFTKVKDFCQLARDIERFCPDVTDGFPSLDAVESELRSSRKLYLWWD